MSVASEPPATRIYPSASNVAVAPWRATASDAAEVKVRVPGSQSSTDTIGTGTPLAMPLDPPTTITFQSGSTEPCAMCAGAIYWSGIVRVVYALSEHGLAAIVAEQEGVPTMHLPCREVFARGGRPVAVAGPADLPEASAVHEGFWG